MYRFSSTAILALTMVCSAAFAQNADDTSILDRSPSENASVGAAAARGPASWVARARARHNQLIQSRVTANPQIDDPRNFGNSGSTGSSATDLLGGLAGLLGGTGGSSISDLLNLAGSFGIDTSNIGGLLSGQQTPAATTGGDLNTPEGSGISQGDVADAGAEDALAQLLALRDGLDSADSRSQVRDDTSAGDEFNSFGFLKDDPRSQQQTDDEPKFAVRLVDSWMNTVFTALTIGMQTPAFIDTLADGLRSIFGLPDPDAADNGTNTGGGTDGGTTGDPNTGGTNTGGTNTGGTNTGGNAIDDLGNGSIV